MKRGVIYCILLCTVLSIQASEIYFRHLGLKDGLSQINVLSIYQDEVGAMWFGSSEGLNRYNGDQIEVFRPKNNDGLTQNIIYSLCGNKKGVIYIRTTSDLIRYDVYRNEFNTLRKGGITYTTYYHNRLWATTNDSIFFYTESTKELTCFTTLAPEVGEITGIHVSSDKEVWVSTTEKLLLIPMDQPERYEEIREITGGQCFFRDSHDHLWIGTQNNGMYKITNKSVIAHYTEQGGLSNNQVRDILEDEEGNIWVATFLGLNKYTPSTGMWRCYMANDEISYGLTHSSIFALYRDVQNTIWVGTYYGGINYFSPRTDICRFYGANSKNEHFLSFPFVGNMVEDSEQNIWICTEGGGLNYYDRKKDTFEHFTSLEGGNGAISHNNLKCIWYRKDKNWLYIGTHTGGLSIFDINRKKSRVLKYDPDDPYSLPNNVINRIQPYGTDLVVLTQVGIFRMDLETEKFYPLSKDETVEKLVCEKLNYETFLIDKNSKLWLANTDGGLSCVHLITNRIERYLPDMEHPNSIGKYKIINIFEDKKGNIYFGTLGSGLFRYDPEQDAFINFNRQRKELLSDYCYFVTQTNRDDLIILHNRGFSFFDPASNTLKYAYNFYNLGFTQGSSVLQASDGQLFIGGIDGMISFSEDQIRKVNKDYRLYFDKLYINNKRISPGDETGILKAILPKTDRISLKSKQNNVTVVFSSSNYFPDLNNMYEYKLEDFDQSWISVTNHRIVYTNLNPGIYRLRLREVGGTYEPDKEVDLIIEIRAPFYRSSVAYMIYIMGLFLAFFFTVNFYARQARLKASLEYERKEKERIKELNQVKLKFFTNISHEFRTPLTLIIGQIEYLLQLNKFSPAIYNRILRIYKNAWHMRDLISELLDFRKQEQGYLKLKVECRDIVAYVKEVYMYFYEYSLNKHITYKFEHFEDEIEVWFDPLQLKKVIFNLLSNAFKYTPENGSITVIVKKNLHHVDIKIKDNGPGIHKKDIDRIFEQFYQTDNLASDFTTGTGIGLALSKSIVDLHKGEIWAETEVGKGTVLTVRLLLGSAHFNEEDMQNNPPESSFIFETPEIATVFAANGEDKEEDTLQSERKPTILIVEDSKELLDMLEDIFLPIYNVYTATNGKEGFEMTRQIKPDLVLSDVMMPEMSGKEMCYKIKNSIELSHIPVILLTAQTAVEYAIEGYMFGADDYITKPFNIKLLVARCNNLIKARKQLLEKFDQKQEAILMTGAVNESDKVLIENTIAIIKANFDNPEFDMNMLANELNIGRSKLYSKIKEVTGFTPNDFALKIKLDEAMYLLNNHPELNITEISYRLGFSSARYFSKCFKDLFGVAPQSMKKKSR